MNTKVVSFQIVQGYISGDRRWTPDVIALCEDGSLWCIGLDEFQSGNGASWKRMTPEIPQTTYHFMASNPAAGGR